VIKILHGIMQSSTDILALRRASNTTYLKERVIKGVLFLETAYFQGLIGDKFCSQEELTYFTSANSYTADYLEVQITPP